MAVTHFEITQLPNSDIVLATIGGNPIVANTIYDIADQNTVSFKRTDEVEGLFVKDSLVWKAHNQIDSIIGNEALLDLKWEPADAGLLPISSDVSQSVENEQILNLLSLLPLNEAVEYIEIISVSGSGELSLNNQSLFSGQKIEIKDLYYTQYIAPLQGGGEPLFTLSYKVGRGDTVQATTYTLEFNIELLAEISKTSESTFNSSGEYIVLGSPVIYNDIKRNFDIEIEKALSLSTVNIEVKVECPFLALNSLNEVIINAGGQVITKTSDETFNIYVEVNSQGFLNFTISNLIVLDTLNEANGKITLTLLDVNGDPLLINGEKNVVELYTLENADDKTRLNFTKPKNQILTTAVLALKS